MKHLLLFKIMGELERTSALPPEISKNKTTLSLYLEKSVSILDEITVTK